MSRRTERLSELLRAEIARALREDISDPRIGQVTLTRVDVAPDMSHAVVFFSGLEARDEDAVATLAAGLESASGRLRTLIAKRLVARKMPELRFRHDPSLELGGETLRLLEQLSDGQVS